MKTSRKYFIQLFTAMLICAVYGQSKAVSIDVHQGKSDAATCIACHGEQGNTDVSAWPKLAGQHASYLVKQMLEFQQGQEGPRPNETMNTLSLTLTKDQIANTSAYFASQITQIGQMSSENLKAAEKLYRGGDTTRGLPACMSCHGPSGNGIASAKFPKLSGQNPEYTYQQLKAFKEGLRKNDPNGMMRNVALKLSDEDMRILANYLFALH